MKRQHFFQILNEIILINLSFKHPDLQYCTIQVNHKKNQTLSSALRYQFTFVIAHLV